MEKHSLLYPQPALTAPLPKRKTTKYLKGTALVFVFGQGHLSPRSFYCQPTELREGNVFRFSFVSVCSGGIQVTTVNLGCARFTENLSELTKTWSSGATECRV